MDGWRYDDVGVTGRKETADSENVSADFGMGGGGVA
eukprot:CAMPEP_0172515904 /NCGR_PEP_ID=MMETSP1066-20121228/271889_1 /TAXON_ID=671091 /ORGANISM="Coscinodiscus wailesii, Strain CCMP2513" /LENGTH=35 /DNA_ID= /DNA_START= /DNA_END= /DNA_ORIENTATION=